MTKTSTMSFVIPALNEADNIASTIHSIRRVVPARPEIIVCDNGSTDETVQIASDQGATVYEAPGRTIAGLRNLGAGQASGDLIIFLDADVSLDRDWYSEWLNAQHWLPANALYVTGNRCRPSEKGGFFERNWFRVLSKTASNYINSGHLITTRTLFDRIGGFDESLTTGEDHDFCLRAANAGGTIVPVDKLIAFHNGYPKTTLGFIRREIWHGQEDKRSLDAFLGSKTAILAAIHLLFVIATLSFLLAGLMWLSAALVLLLASIPVLMTLAKFGALRPLQLLKTAACAELYLIARGMALMINVKPNQA